MYNKLIIPKKWRPLISPSYRDRVLVQENPQQAVVCHSTVSMVEGAQWWSVEAQWWKAFNGRRSSPQGAGRTGPPLLWPWVPQCSCRLWAVVDYVQCVWGQTGLTLPPQHHTTSTKRQQNQYKNFHLVHMAVIHTCIYTYISQYGTVVMVGPTNTHEHQVSIFMPICE